MISIISDNHRQKLKNFSESMIDIECAHHNLKNLGSIFINLEQANDVKTASIKQEISNQLPVIEKALENIKELIGEK